jgi:hypothetical protein
MAAEQIDLSHYIKVPHGAYTSSILDLDVSPEYNIGEVSLAALYRRVGWQYNDGDRSSVYSETRVIEKTSDFFKKLSKIRNPGESPGILNLEDWKLALSEVLSSPKMPNQVKSKNPILYPLVPDCALYSSAARLKGNPWNPGKLIEKIIVVGSTSTQAEVIWHELFESFTCNPSDDREDIWARIVSLEFSKWRDSNITWSINRMSASRPSFDDEVIQASPAFQFISDLKNVLKLKAQLSRRQWLSVVESLLRIASASHVLWICSLNIAVWEYLKDCISGHSRSKQDLLRMIKANCSDFWQLEEKAIPLIKKKIQSFTQSRIAINYVLYQPGLEQPNTFNLDSIDGIYELGNVVNRQIESKVLSKDILLTQINDIYEIDPGLINCKKGASANLFEFIRYSLGQKQTAEPQKRSFDQSFWLRKSGNYSAAPWVVDLGPTSILTMAYCCSYNYEQNRTIKDFLKHLNNYGFQISQRDFENSKLLESLTTLQIIGDSPDAEGGMIIMNPFGATK